MKGFDNDRSYVEIRYIQIRGSIDSKEEHGTSRGMIWIINHRKDHGWKNQIIIFNKETGFNTRIKWLGE